MEFPTEFSEETKKLVALWGEIIQDKHKDDDEEIFCCDPLLIIEYNQPGLISRNITEVNVANGTKYYVPIAFPSQHLQQSNSVFAFNCMQTVEDAIRDLYDNFHNAVTGRQDPIVGRVYKVVFRRGNTFEVAERHHVFD
ncbi:24443_t:CDS:2 [Dentiscutata erythropus]|uniref:24443_t:CDS:1 n=1 Tax=Dentiscutata erythropus TaxID=1348616 RepID=A0A9N9HU70_9GLOM|nr:24443_t:CDS:2 [Dentiscutata erythropus]